MAPAPIPTASSVALGIHAGPEIVMPEHRELAVAGEPGQRLALEDAILLGRQIAVEITAEEEIAAIDPGRMQLRLFDELLQFVAVHAKLAETRRRVDPQHRADLAAAQVEIELGRQVCVGQPIAIGYRVMLGVA